MLQFKNLTIERAVANQGGEMEADAIYKNGARQKSQISRGIFKINRTFFIVITIVASTFFLSSCTKEETVNKPGTPRNVKATQNGSYIIITWDENISTRKNNKAESYNIYRSNSKTTYTAPSLLGSSTGTTYTDVYPYSGDNYFWVTAVNSAGESSRSSTYNDDNHVNYSGGGGGSSSSVCVNIQNNYDNAKKKRNDALILYYQFFGTIYASTYENQVNNYNAIMATCQQQAKENGCTLKL